VDLGFEIDGGALLGVHNGQFNVLTSKRQDDILFTRNRRSPVKHRGPVCP